jgi:hypothetical protein
MSSPVLSKPPGNLADGIRGVWWLLSREDWTLRGEKRVDPGLGPDPIAILTYAETYFAAQFMKRNRASTEEIAKIAPGTNNTTPVGGYDAYFGTYEVNEQTGNVMHTLLGAINPANVGISTSRDLRIQNGRLILQLNTSTRRESQSFGPWYGSG